MCANVTAVLTLNVNVGGVQDVEEEILLRLMSVMEQLQRRTYDTISRVEFTSNELGQLLSEMVYATLCKPNVSVTVFCPAQQRRRSIVGYVSSSKMHRDVATWISEWYCGAKSFQVTAGRKGVKDGERRRLALRFSDTGMVTIIPEIKYSDAKNQGFENMF